MTIVDMFWPGKSFDHNCSDWICRISVQVANYEQGILGTLRKTARSYRTIARCAMGLQTKYEEVKLDVATRAKLQEPRHYDKYMNALHNRRFVWEKGEGSTLANVARLETRS
jgi:hypothetical protein